VRQLSTRVRDARVGQWPYGSFVRFRGVVAYREHGVAARSADGGWEFEAVEPGDQQNDYVTICANSSVPPAIGEAWTFVGRVTARECYHPLLGGTWVPPPPPPPPMLIPYVSTGHSRWHPASVAGLVVAAFGTFVFGLYLRRWLKERGSGGTV